MRRRDFLMAMAAAGPVAAYGATWNKLCLGSGSSGTWRKLGSASGSAGTWRKLGGGTDIALTISANTLHYNLYNAAVAAGLGTGACPGAANITLTINSGVFVYSDVFGTPAIEFGALPGDTLLTIVNNGIIMGRGGNSGYSSNRNGSNAINATIPFSINSANGYVLGGGGAGYDLGSGGDTFRWRGGAGAGGGDSCDYNATCTGGGNPGGTATQYFAGGRVVPAAANTSPNVTATTGIGVIWIDPTGSYADAGAVGGGVIDCFPDKYSPGTCGPHTFFFGPGGAMGTAATAGSFDAPYGFTYGTVYIMGSGGGYGANGSMMGSVSQGGSFPISYSGTPGVGGKAIALNGNAVTWIGGFPATRVFGAVS